MSEFDWSRLAEDIGVALSSQLALWLYSWIAVTLVFSASVAYAIWQLRIIRDFNRADIIRRYPGRQPEKPESIKRRIETLRGYAGAIVGTLIARATGIASFGIVVPGLLLAALALYQDWFLPGPPALIVGEAASPASEVTVWRLSTFVLDQALRGGLSDLFEVFGLSVSQVTNNPDNLAYAGFVLGFRFLCGAVVIAIGAMILRIVFGMWGLNEAIRVYQSELERALEASGTEP